MKLTKPAPSWTSFFGDARDRSLVGTKIQASRTPSWSVAVARFVSWMALCFGALILLLGLILLVPFLRRASTDETAWIALYFGGIGATLASLGVIMIIFPAQFLRRKPSGRSLLIGLSTFGLVLGGLLITGGLGPFSAIVQRRPDPAYYWAVGVWSLFMTVNLAALTAMFLPGVAAWSRTKPTSRR